jgi:hypothetical protein
VHLHSERARQPQTRENKQTEVSKRAIDWAAADASRTFARAADLRVTRLSQQEEAKRSVVNRATKAIYVAHLGRLVLAPRTKVQNDQEASEHHCDIIAVSRIDLSASKKSIFFDFFSIFFFLFRFSLRVNVTMSRKPVSKFAGGNHVRAPEQHAPAHTHRHTPGRARSWVQRRAAH